MKQAILITAYNNFQHLIDIIHFFPSNIFELYIHIDKKSKLNLESVKNINVKNVKLLSRRYKVRWGGLNLLKCILLLAEEALKNNDILVN